MFLLWAESKLLFPVRKISEATMLPDSFLPFNFEPADQFSRNLSRQKQAISSDFVPKSSAMILTAKRARCPFHLNFRLLMALMISGEAHKLWR